MSTVITQADVLTAIQQLRAAGKKPTARNIHASLGRGSFTTILAFRREIDSSAPIQTAEPDKGALEHFNQVWHTAYSLGYNSRDAEVQDLKESIEGVTQENDALQTATADAQSKLIDVQHSRDELVKQLAATVGQANEARAASDRYAEDLAHAARTATKLAQALETIESMRQERAELSQQLNQLEEINSRQAAEAQKLQERVDSLNDKLQDAATDAADEKRRFNLVDTERDAMTKRAHRAEDELARLKEQQEPTGKPAKKTPKKGSRDLHPETPGYTDSHAQRLIEGDTTPDLPHVR